MGVVDLSQLKNKNPEKKSYEDLSPEEQAQVDAMAEKHAAEIPGHKCRTAFLVIVEEDGGVVPVPDLEFKVNRSWAPTSNDYLSAAAFLQASILMQSTANTTVMGMQQMAMAQAQMLQNQHLASQLNLK